MTSVNHLFALGIFLAGIALFGSGCTNDQLPEPQQLDCTTQSPTYDQEIKPIIEASCAYSGCHLDSSPGRFDTYSGLLPYLQDGKFRQRVISLRSDPVLGMPPELAPAGRPTELTETELEMITCWLDAGFPE